MSNPMVASHPAPRFIAQQWASALLLLIVLLGLGASLSGLRLALAVWRMTEAHGPVAASPLPVRLSLAGEVFAVPADLIRFPPGAAAAATGSGAVTTGQIELAMDWGRLPGLDPAPGDRRFHLTLIAGGDPVSASARFDRIYRPFFEGEEIAGPDGLVGRRLAAESGYGGETLFYAFAREGAENAGDQRFTIRCGLETNSLAPALCVRQLSLSPKLRIAYRYRRNRLDQWRAIEAAVGALIAEFRQARDG